MSIHRNIRRWAGRVVILALACTACMAMLVQDADARRFGGGKSFGRQSSTVTQQQSPPPAKNAATQPAQQQAQSAQSPVQQPGVPPRNRWLGPLAGLAAGLGIAALLSHFGMMGPFAETLGSVLMLALLVVAGLAVWRMLRGSRNAPYRYQPQPAPAYGGSDLDDQPLPRMASVGARPGSVADVLSGSSASASSAPAAPWGVPADFDVPAFIRSAKVHFIRLQAAWDARNLADIREFTTPEVYAEVKMQLDEERGANHHTEVVGLEAQLLGIEEGATDYLASVRFSGAMREDDSSSAEPFQEVWNLAKPKDGRSGWLLSGIQQLH